MSMPTLDCFSSIHCLISSILIFFEVIKMRFTMLTILQNKNKVLWLSDKLQAALEAGQ